MHFGQRFQDGLHLNGRHILSGQHKCFEVVFLISLKCLKTGTSIKLCKSIIFKKKKKNQECLAALGSHGTMWTAPKAKVRRHTCSCAPSPPVLMYIPDYSI